MIVNTTPGPGHNNPPTSREDFIAAIELWASARRVADALTTDEIKEISVGKRLPVFSRAKLEAVAYALRKNPRENAKYGVLDAIYALADNDRGYCDMSQERLAQFFGRSRKHINECLYELENLGVICIEKIPGAVARIHPIVPRALAQQPGQILWLFDALAPYRKPAKPGRKPKIPVTTSVTPISSKIPVTDELPVTTMVTPNSKYLSPKTQIGVTTAVTQISYESPIVEEVIKTSYTQALDYGLTEDDFTDFNDGMNCWITSDAKNQFPRKEPRSFTDKHLLKMFRAWTTSHPVEIVLTAFRSVNSNASITTAKFLPTHAGYCKYIESAMNGRNGSKGALEQITISHGRYRTAFALDQELGKLKIDTQREIGSQQIAAHSRAIEKNAAARSTKSLAALSAKPDGAPAERFNDDEKKVHEVAGTWIDGFLCNRIMDDTEATKQQVRGALLSAYNDLGGKVEKPDPNKVAQAVKRRLLFEKYGSPETRCDGDVGKLPNEHGSPRDAKLEWVAISQKFINRLVEQYPRSDLLHVFICVWKNFESVFNTMTAEKYVRLQAQVEISFEEFARKQHEEAVARHGLM